MKGQFITLILGCLFGFQPLSAVCQPGSLTSFYEGDDKAYYYVRQIDSVVYWFGEDVNGHWSRGFKGKIHGDTLKGEFHNLTKGSRIIYHMTPLPKMFGVSEPLVLRIKHGQLIQIGGDSVSNKCRIWTKKKAPDQLPVPDPTPQFGDLIGRDVDCVFQGQPSGCYYYMRSAANDKIIVFGEKLSPDGRTFEYSRLFWGKRDKEKGFIMLITGVDLPKTQNKLGSTTKAIRFAIAGSNLIQIGDPMFLPDTLLVRLGPGNFLPFKTTNKSSYFFELQRSIILFSFLLVFILGLTNRLKKPNPRKVFLTYSLFLFFVYLYSTAINFKQVARSVEPFFDYNIALPIGEFISNNSIMSAFLLLSGLSISFIVAINNFFIYFIGHGIKTKHLLGLGALILIGLIPMNIFISLSPYNEINWEMAWKVNYLSVLSFFILLLAYFVNFYIKSHFSDKLTRQLYLNILLCALFFVAGFCITATVLLFGYSVDNFFYLHLGTGLSVLYFYQTIQQNGKIIEIKKEENFRKLVQQQTDNTQLHIKLMEKELENAQIKTQKLIADALSLKAQLNPHLIFNCLNSIKSRIQNQKPEGAVAYLEHFSIYLRMMLDHTGDFKISLEEELNFCNAFLRMEAHHLEDFKYQVTIQDTVDASFVKIPAFILQPFLENAIKHGLSTMEGEKKLFVELKRQGEELLCTITDNGIGRNEAKRRQSRELHTVEKHIGIQNTLDRLHIFQQTDGYMIRFEFKDLFDASGKAAGTSVIFYFPI